MADQIPVKVNIVSGTAMSLAQFDPTDTVGIPQGGTSAADQQTAINNLTNVGGYPTGYVLTKDGSGNATFQVAAGGGGGAVTSVAGKVGIVTLVPGDVGLGNVDNTSDINKPLSTATSAALGAKQATLVSGTNIKTINGVTLLGSGNFSVGSPWLNVIDFGADKTGVTDSAAAFQNTINALPTNGGRIIVPDGAYLINTNPALGAKSVYWDIGVGTVFTGSGTGLGQFPYVKSVGGQKSVGPLIQSQSLQNVGNPNGGIAALQVEMLQPSTYGAGNSLACYFGATSNNANPLGNTWALNTLINVGSEAQGTHQCIEIDVDCDSSAALVKGISISGAGAANPDVGLEIVRVPGTVWDRGIDILYSTMGIQIRNTCSGGISINAPAQTVDTPIGAKQRITGGDAIVLQRTNDSTTGNFIRGVNSANTLNQFTIDGSGNSYFQLGTYAGFLTASAGVGTTQLFLSQAAGASPSGVVCLGSTVTSSATAGIAALPSNPTGFLKGYLGGAEIRIPYYNA